MAALNMSDDAGTGMKNLTTFVLCLFLGLVSPTLASASGGLDGKSFNPFWAIPFIGLLISIAVFPLVSHTIWERHQGKISAIWSALIIIPLWVMVGGQSTVAAIIHAVVLDYIPFILMLVALFTAAGGIVIRGNLHGSPLSNGLILVFGSLLASVIGTTGASMVLIRPLIRANDNRKHNAHVIIFFIFLVSNIGGSLTPLGDPPLFLGFLKGVHFFWTTTHLAFETLIAGGVVLICFLALDLYFYRKEGITRDPTPDSAIEIGGLLNGIWIVLVIAAILVSANWRPGTLLTLAGIPIEGQNIARDSTMVVVTLLSLLFTSKASRQENGFNWTPVKEVAVLFAGIFVTMIPVVAMLQAGTDGPFASLVQLVTHADGTPNVTAYFWLTGLLSSFLDNAPTYLVFFELAGGDATRLMTEGSTTLAALSAGAVFMGAMSYIGNAPNFMVYAIARERGVRMPSFFGYVLWSGSILLPTYAILTYIFFR
jgi:Na+/H+ antiporter NhaD/arsenite permease-like protein